MARDLVRTIQEEWDKDLPIADALATLTHNERPPLGELDCVVVFLWNSAVLSGFDSNHMPEGMNQLQAAVSSGLCSR